MPALNFKKRFVLKIEDGSKRHTIRAKRKRAWKVGDDLALQYGSRYRPQRIFNARCIGVSDIRIHVSDEGYILITIDGESLDHTERDGFARADGFEDQYDMLRFWIDNHGIGRFEGDVIYWDYETRRHPQKLAA